MKLAFIAEQPAGAPAAAAPTPTIAPPQGQAAPTAPIQGQPAAAPKVPVITQQQTAQAADGLYNYAVAHPEDAGNIINFLMAMIHKGANGPKPSIDLFPQALSTMQQKIKQPAAQQPTVAPVQGQPAPQQAQQPVQ